MGVEKGRKKLRRADKVKWPGVYVYKTDKITRGGKPDITYFISYRDGKKKVWEKVGRKSEGITPQIADEIRSNRTLKARHGEAILTAKQIKKKKARANRPLDEIAEEYFKQRGGSEQAAKFDQYRYDKHVKPVVGHRAIASLTPLDMKRIERAMPGAAPATVWGAFELVRRISNFGKRSKMSEGLTFTIKMPKRDNELTEFLTPDEAGRLLKTLDDWKAQDVANMLKVAMFSGLRRGEIFKLQDSDIDYANKLIRLQTPKGGKTASVPLNPIVEQILKNQIAWRDERFEKKQVKAKETLTKSNYLFPGKGGAQRVDCSAAYRIKVEADLPKRFRIFHGLRHHYAVMLANSGEFTIDMIGELLTHKSNDMTRRYAKFLPGSLKKAGDRAAELIQQNISEGTTNEKEIKAG
jgi:integrase